METAKAQKNTVRKHLKGVVVSAAMKDTIVVLVEDYKKHSKYEKYFLRGKKYKAHDKGNTALVGDEVVIEECRPISKEKKFTLVTISKKKSHAE